MPTGKRIPVLLVAAALAAAFALTQASAWAKDPKAPPMEEIIAGKTPLWIEVADTLEKQERGLMFRRSMPENEGMIFVYMEPIEMSFRMSFSYTFTQKKILIPAKLL